MTGLGATRIGRLSGWPARAPALLAVLSMLALLSACAQSWEWGRPCGTAEELRQDREECIGLSGNDSGVMNLTTSRFVDSCLAERGWQKTKPGEALACGTASPPKEAAPAEPPAPAAGDPRGDFDACFERCRELTDRSKEECFDTCLAR